MMGTGHPFPFLMVDPGHDKLGAIRNAGEPYIIWHAPPHPDGERKSYAKPGMTQRRDGRHDGNGSHWVECPAWEVIPQTIRGTSWSSARGDYGVARSSITIAVVDDAVDTRHREFTGRVAGQWDAATGLSLLQYRGWQPHDKVAVSRSPLGNRHGVAQRLDSS